jgi:hypothetical protein
VWAGGASIFSIRRGDSAARGEWRFKRKGAERLVGSDLTRLLGRFAGVELCSTLDKSESFDQYGLMVEINCIKTYLYLYKY